MSSVAALVQVAHELEKRKPLSVDEYVPSPIQLDLRASLGAISIGVWVSNILYGANLVQFVRYWSHFTNDHILMKLIVASLMVFDFVGSFGYMRLAWFWQVVNWGNTLALEVIDWGFFVDILMTGLVPTIVQWYFAWRVYAVSGRRARVLPGLIILLSLMQCGFSIATVPVAWNLGVAANFHKYLWGVYSWFIPGCVADALITSSMLYYLHSARKTSDFARTRGILNKFIVLVFETNAVTFIAALSILITFATTNETSLAYNALTYVAAKLYCLSLLLATNIRIDLREGSGTTTSTSNPNVHGQTNLAHSGIELASSVDRRKYNAAPAPKGWPTRSFSDTQTPRTPNYAQAVNVTITTTKDESEKSDVEIGYARGGHELQY